jgi:hypothetical protein
MFRKLSLRLLILSAIYWFFIRKWHIRWGATEEETKMPIPGDEIVPRPKFEATRAITIQAPVEKVWPWIVQMGQGRGGLYSYERLENLAGCQIKNADRIHPEWQDFKPGEMLRLGPEGYPAYPVVSVQPPTALVLGGGEPKNGWHSWVFYLCPIDEQTTRLIHRDRNDYVPNLGNFIMWRVFTEPASFVMTRKMLLGIKERAEKK